MAANTGLRTRIHGGDPIWGQAEPGFSSFKNMMRQTVAILSEGQFERKDTTFNFRQSANLSKPARASRISRGTFSTRRVPVIKRAAVLCSRSRHSALIVPRPLQARDAYSRTGRTQVRKRVWITRGGTRGRNRRSKPSLEEVLLTIVET